MPEYYEDYKILTTRVRINPDSHSRFVDWQAELKKAITTFPGFTSLEILSKGVRDEITWTFKQRFNTLHNLNAWKDSPERIRLLEALKFFLVKGDPGIQDEVSNASDQSEGVTEVIITEVNPENEDDYRLWMAKIHQVEAKFPGFRGVYVQSPHEGGGRHWITLLQFDCPKSLDFWLNSPERQDVLSESKAIISSLESHRVISPFAGWFSSIARTGESPPVWKQTMIILLVLFPIVMLELKFLLPLLTSFNSSVATFISNAISVSLISWPMMPIAIWFLGWWLTPNAYRRTYTTILGTILLIVLYLLEIGIFWNIL